MNQFLKIADKAALIGRIRGLPSGPGHSPFTRRWASCDQPHNMVARAEYHGEDTFSGILSTTVPNPGKSASERYNEQ